MLATLPHLGQAAAPPPNEKQQPQKHATFVIIDTFSLCAWPRLFAHGM
jgi:hypothetical protein